MADRARGRRSPQTFERFGLGEVPPTMDPIATCFLHGGLKQQVMTPDGIYNFLCGDGYNCAFFGSEKNCNQGSPTDVLSTGQASPPPSATAQQNCASHGGVYTEVADSYSTTTVCMDGTTCTSGAEATGCQPGTKPTPAVSEGGCPPFGYLKDGACACMPGYQAYGSGAALLCTPIPNVALPQLNGGPVDVNGIPIKAGLLTKPIFAPTLSRAGAGLSLTLSPTTGANGAGPEVTLKPATTTTSTLAKVGYWVLGGFAVLAIGVGGYVAYEKIRG